MALSLSQGGRGGDDIGAGSSGRGIDEAPLVVTTGPAPIPAIRHPCPTDPDTLTHRLRRPLEG